MIRRRLKLALALAVVGALALIGAGCSGGSEPPDVVEGYHVTDDSTVDFDGATLNCIDVFKDGGFVYAICGDPRTDDQLCFGPDSSEDAYLGSLLTDWPEECQKAAETIVGES
jgi:hypothetical protein